MRKKVSFYEITGGAGSVRGEPVQYGEPVHAVLVHLENRFSALSTDIWVLRYTIGSFFKNYNRIRIQILEMNDPRIRIINCIIVESGSRLLFVSQISSDRRIRSLHTLKSDLRSEIGSYDPCITVLILQTIVITNHSLLRSD